MHSLFGIIHKEAIMFRKIVAFILIALLLSGCVQMPALVVTNPSTAPVDITEDTNASTSSATTEDTQTTTVPAIEETTAATEAEVVIPVETTTEAEPEHSDLFLSYVSPDDMVQYFSEVVLDAEFVNSGDASVLQRWESTICYKIYGDPTVDDMEVLANFVDYLNTIEGFPGMRESEGNWEENLSIYFCDQQELMDRMGDQHWDLDGIFTFWYDGWNTIYDCTICIRTDIDQEVRNSVILEEIYNALGPAQDTDLRQESIIYSGYSIPQALHPIDQVILQLLYHPAMACGMTIDQCDTIIRQLYY